jgi:succinate dehydrogenase / fumarate reductase, cytochrome b subunit
MNQILRFYTSSVGKKLLMGLTGLFLLSFLCIHLYVNLFLFKADSGETYDAYAAFMAGYPLIRPLEIALFLGFVLHAALAGILWFKNWRVRPQGYSVDNTGKSSAFSSRFVVVTGAGLFAFLLYHIYSFSIKYRFSNIGGGMSSLVADAFANPWIVTLYETALLFLAFHLKHGFQSAFQTFGLKMTKYEALIDLLAVLFWLILPLCFAVLPAYLFWIRGGASS